MRRGLCFELVYVSQEYYLLGVCLPTIHLCRCDWCVRSGLDARMRIYTMRAVIWQTNKSDATDRGLEFIPRAIVGQDAGQLFSSTVNRGAHSGLRIHA